jgi:hypothetical protein
MITRALFLALPAVAGLACSTTHSDKTARTDKGGTAREVGSAGTGMASGDVKGHASDQVITGRVANASPGALVIESATGERQTLSLVEQTVVTIDGRDSSVSSLQAGQDVRASFNEVNGQRVAVKVEAMPMRGSDTYTPASPPGTSPTEAAPGTSPNPPMHPGTSDMPAPSQPAPTETAPSGTGGRY